MKMFWLKWGIKKFERLLGMEIGGNLNFDVFSLLKKAGRTPAVLARLA